MKTTQQLVNERNQAELELSAATKMLSEAQSRRAKAQKSLTVAQEALISRRDAEWKSTMSAKA